jgi:putative sterol carrier protein
LVISSRDPRFVFSADLKTFLAMGTGEVGVGEAISSGRAVLEGDPEAAVQCARMFAIPGVVQDESPRR